MISADLPPQHTISGTASDSNIRRGTRTQKGRDAIKSPKPVTLGQTRTNHETGANGPLKSDIVNDITEHEPIQSQRFQCRNEKAKSPISKGEISKYDYPQATTDGDSHAINKDATISSHSTRGGFIQCRETRKSTEGTTPNTPRRSKRLQAPNWSDNKDNDYIYDSLKRDNEVRTSSSEHESSPAGSSSVKKIQTLQVTHEGRTLPRSRNGEVRQNTEIDVKGQNPPPLKIFIKGLKEELRVEYTGDQTGKTISDEKRQNTPSDNDQTKQTEHRKFETNLRKCGPKRNSRQRQHLTKKADVRVGTERADQNETSSRHAHSSTIHENAACLSLSSEEVTAISVKKKRKSKIPQQDNKKEERYAKNTFLSYFLSHIYNGVKNPRAL